VLPPRQFHATYAGIAQSFAADAAPALVWGRAQAHLCLGQAAPCRLAPDIAVPVVRRPLGGGAVWVDEGQLVYVLIAPLRLAPSRPADWCAWALQPAMATFERFGLHVRRHGEDLWLDGCKIAGTGSATIGACAVFASSFLLRFPKQAFAACMSGSGEYRRWLEQGLAATLTDWSAHAVLPSSAALLAAYREALGATLGWSLVPADLGATEADAIAEAVLDMDDGDHAGADLAQTDAIKLNADSYLAEHVVGNRRVRELVVRGMLARRAAMNF
jgi:lipoate-protein ligase A